MSRPATLLEGLCGHTLLLGAQSIQVECKDRRTQVFAMKDTTRIRIANYPASGADAKELLGNLKSAIRKPIRALIEGHLHILNCRVSENLSSTAYDVSIVRAPRPDPSLAPSFTAKQGQYLAFIDNYTKIHGQPPAESDLGRYFQVSPPSIHGMIRTLERNSLIEKVPGQARSIRLLVRSEHLPRLAWSARHP